MAKEESKNAKTAADSVRKVLFNFDLELVAANGELDLTRAKIQRYADKKNRLEIERFTSARIDEEKLKIFVQQLIDGKNKTWKSMENLLNTYTPKYKTIWLMYFISQYSYEEIAEQTGYTIEGINFIIRKLKKDLIDLAKGEKEEEQ